MKIDNVQISADCEEVLQELRNQLEINQIPLLQKPPRQSGNSLQVQCPYHSNGQERKASAGIRKEDGKFHCFSCGEIHTFPEVVSYCFGKNDMGMYGIQWLMKNFGTVEKEERKDVELDMFRNRSIIRDYSVDDTNIDSFSCGNNICRNSGGNNQYVTEKELEKYRFYHPYMYKRKLTDEIIDLFDIGYDRKTKCLTFPVRDIHGNCLFLARRSVETKYFNYPAGAEKPLYGLYELNQVYTESYRDSDRMLVRKTLFPTEIIICESMLDALTCWVYGKYALALNGTGNELQFRQLRDLPCRCLVLATDNDPAGWKARDRIRKNVDNKLIMQYDYDTYPPMCKDINDMTEVQFQCLEKIF